MTACTADDIASTEEPMDNPVNFTINMRGGATRAFTTYDNYWKDDTHIAICEGNTVYDYKTLTESSTSGARVSLTPNSATTGNAFFWTPTDASRTFSAWYPYATSAPSSGVVDEDQSTMSAGAYDILYAPAVTVINQVGRASKESVNLDFYHQMCRIVVTVNSSATKGSKPVTDIKMGKGTTGNNNGNMAISRAITELGVTGSESTGTPTKWEDETKLTKNKTITMRNMSGEDACTTHFYTFECVIPPQSLAATEVLFQITTTDANNSANNRTSKYVPQDMFTDAPNFQAGYQYNYSITLSKSGAVNISTVQIYDWSSESIPGQNATIPDASYEI